MTTLRRLLPYGKAVAAGLTALVGSLGVALADGRVEPTEVGGIAGAVVIAVAAVWRTPNKAA